MIQSCINWALPLRMVHAGSLTQEARVEAAVSPGERLAASYSSSDISTAEVWKQVLVPAISTLLLLYAQDLPHRRTEEACKLNVLQCAAYNKRSESSPRLWSLPHLLPGCLMGLSFSGTLRFVPQRLFQLRPGLTMHFPQNGHNQTSTGTIILHSYDP